MTAYNYYAASASGQKRGAGYDRTFLQQVTVDFAQVSNVSNGASYDTVGTNIVAADTINVMVIPANTYVSAVIAAVKEANGVASSAFQLGDASSAAGWLAAMLLNVLNTTKTIQADAYSQASTNGKIYTTATPLLMTISTASTGFKVGKVVVTAVCHDYSEMV